MLSVLCKGFSTGPGLRLALNTPCSLPSYGEIRDVTERDCGFAEGRNQIPKAFAVVILIAHFHCVVVIEGQLG